jgi:hypothetical protein
MNPYRDPGLRAELGLRALSALMSADDWREILDRWLALPEWARYQAGDS